MNNRNGNSEPGKGRGWIWGGGAAVLAVVLVIGLAGRGNAPEVQVVKVSHDKLDAAIESNGKVEPVNAYVVRAQIAAFVLTVDATEGQPIRKGQRILTLNSSDAQAQLAAARADLLSAQSDLRNARTGGNPSEVAQLDGDLGKAQAQVASLEQTRQALQQLQAKQAATQAEIDKNGLELATARATLESLQKRRDDLTHRASLDVERLTLRVQQDEAQVRSLEEKVKSAMITSPVDGTLYALSVRAGDYVTIGQEIADMADLHKVQVRAFVDEPDLGFLAPDQEVHITWDAMPNRDWTGRTIQIPKQVIAHGNRSVGEVLCSVDNDKLELLPNVNVEVRILVRERTNVLSVSRAAVRVDGAERYVFRVEDGRLRRRDITIGIASASKYEVLSGLSDGDRVAIPGETDLKDGMVVRSADAK
jgi:HlyD family secretion protein